MSDSPTEPSSLETQIIQPNTAPPGGFKQVWADLVQLLTEPRLFFSTRYSQLSLNYSLAFAIGVAWLGAALDWLTRVLRNETLLDGLLKMRDQLQSLPIWKNLPADIWAQNSPTHTMMPAWIAELSGIALAPFSTLVGLLMRGLILYFGAYLLMPKREGDSPRDPVTLANCVKIAALASVPNIASSLLGFLPFGLGGLIGWVYALAIFILAISIRFQVSQLRSVAIILLPGLIASFAFACIFGTIFTLIFGTIAALFQVQ